MTHILEAGGDGNFVVDLHAISTATVDAFVWRSFGSIGSLTPNMSRDPT